MAERTAEMMAGVAMAGQSTMEMRSGTAQRVSSAVAAAAVVAHEERTAQRNAAGSPRPLRPTRTPCYAPPFCWSRPRHRRPSSSLLEPDPRRWPGAGESTWMGRSCEHLSLLRGSPHPLQLLVPGLSPRRTRQLGAPRLALVSLDLLDPAWPLPVDDRLQGIVGGSQEAERFE